AEELQQRVARGRPERDAGEQQRESTPHLELPATARTGPHPRDEFIVSALVPTCRAGQYREKARRERAAGLARSASHRARIVETSAQHLAPPGQSNRRDRPDLDRFASDG